MLECCALFPGTRSPRQFINTYQKLCLTPKEDSPRSGCFSAPEPGPRVLSSLSSHWRCDLCFGEQWPPVTLSNLFLSPGMSESLLQCHHLYPEARRCLRTWTMLWKLPGESSCSQGHPGVLRVQHRCRQATGQGDFPALTAGETVALIMGLVLYLLLLSSNLCVKCTF